MVGGAEGEVMIIKVKTRETKTNLGMIAGLSVVISIP